MHQLVTIPPIATVPMLSVVEAEIASVMSYAEQEKSAGTRAAYRSDWAIFTAWCDARGLQSLPASPAVTARFLSHQADNAKKASTIGRRAAAIAYAHKLAGHEPPTNAEAVRAVVRGIRRSIGTAPVRKFAATADVIGEMLKHCPNTLIGLRDRALLCLGFAAALRRSELVALQVSDLEATADGYRVLIRRSKGDQEGAGQIVAVPRGCRIEPCLAVERWLAASGITEGALFPQIKKGSRLQTESLSGHSAAAIVKRYAKAAGLDPSTVAGHSLRAGYATSAAEAGASVLRIVEQTRHRSLDMLTVYVRRANMFKDHSGSAFL